MEQNLLIGICILMVVVIYLIITSRNKGDRQIPI